ncbi:MAG: hypothetical protein IT366_13775 [Candidatus Hydrogenedentes bacterium]|nr:hypothetical protein [Candidatus Hydrogenedentota bacterium]
MKKIVAVLLYFIALNCAQAQVHSELWGKDGEPWTPESRLPDFSFAGFHRGEAPLPSPQVTHNVRDYGAVGDGKTDDSDSFLKALADMREGVLSVPEGRYVITKILVVDKSRLVIRGEDPSKTTLYFPKPLNDIKPNQGETTSGRPTSNYSWSGGFIWLQGDINRKKVAAVTAPAKRGATAITIDDTSKVSVGQELELRLDDEETNSLANHLYSNDPRISMEKILGRTRVTMLSRVTKIDGQTITLDRPLRWDIELRWKPIVSSVAPTVTESGIENLRFEFPNTPYEGHFTELGNNAFALSNTVHCWVRNIHVHNADSGGFVSGMFNTIDGMRCSSERKVDKTRKSTGHHGVTLGGADNLMTNFDFQTEFIHDLTVSNSAGNVFSEGRGVDLSLDHHRRAPHENLFANIDVGKGTRIWMCGGGADLGAHCGARGTFWNIRAANPIEPPDKNFGPWSMNFVGLKMDIAPETNAEGRWFEHTDVGAVQPANLHQAQLARRLGAK